MSEIKPEGSQAVPFFARFLEGQNVEDLSDEASEAISGGIKEGGCVHPTSPKKDEIFTTLKYPSDNEENTYVTLKYPSDGEDSPS